MIEWLKTEMVEDQMVWCLSARSDSHGYLPSMEITYGSSTTRQGWAALGQASTRQIWFQLGAGLSRPDQGARYSLTASNGRWKRRPVQENQLMPGLAVSRQRPGPAWDDGLPRLPARPQN